MVTPIGKLLWAFVVMASGAAIAIPLYRYADRDDAPGGMVIAVGIFVASAALAIWIVNQRPKSTAKR